MIVNPMKSRLCKATVYLFAALFGPAVFAEQNGAQIGDIRCQSKPLNILLTNDDGFDTPGIVALHDVLAAAGHNVKRIAPMRNFSGSSASINITEISVTPSPSDAHQEIYAVDGSPATSVLLGATAIFTKNPPDLIVSGINSGANLGAATPFSGTVGATTAGIKLLQPAVPGIAISTNQPSRDTQAVENQQHMQQVAAFAGRLIGKLVKQTCGKSPILPNHLVLNINYPLLPSADIAGVRVGRQSNRSDFKIGFTRKDDESYVPVIDAVNNSDDSPLSDTALFAEGYITIVPLDGDFTATKFSHLKLSELLRTQP